MASIVNFNTAAAWADAFPTANVSSVTGTTVTGVLSASTVVSNAAGNILADISFIGGATSTPTATNGASYDFYLLPQLHDSSTYADGTGGTTTALPSATYFVGRIVFQVVAGTHSGMVRGIVIPNGTFKWYFVNNSGVATPTGCTCQYRTYSYNLNGS